MRAGSFFVLVTLLFLSLPVFSLETHTVYTEDHYYVTSGTAELSVSFLRASAVLSDFSGYTHWAFRGLDGKDEISKKYIGLLKHIVYRPVEQVFSVIYDVNLRWPFGSRDNVLRFVLSHAAYRGNLLRSMILALEEETVALRDASLNFQIEPRGEGSFITATVRVKFTWLIDLFFDIESYRKSVEWRIQRILINLAEYIEQ
jgi:hypothetical protein